MGLQFSILDACPSREYSKKYFDKSDDEPTRNEWIERLFSESEGVDEPTHNHVSRTHGEGATVNGGQCMQNG